MSKKNASEEAAIKRARQQALDEEKTERRINDALRKEKDANERLRKLLEDDK